MGLTPLAGLVMGTRSGDIDPAVVFHLHREAGLALDEIETMLTRQSGLLGLAGSRRRARGAGAGSRPATPTRPRRWTSSATGCAATSGPTPRRSAGSTRSCSPPGIGENDPQIRADVCAGLAGLRGAARRRAQQCARSGGCARCRRRTAGCGAGRADRRGAGDRPPGAGPGRRLTGASGSGSIAGSAPDPAVGVARPLAGRRRPAPAGERPSGLRRSYLPAGPSEPKRWATATDRPEWVSLSGNPPRNGWGSEPRRWHRAADRVRARRRRALRTR